MDAGMQVHVLLHLIFQNQPLIHAHLVPDDNPVRILPRPAGEADKGAEYDAEDDGNSLRNHSSATITCPGFSVPSRPPAPGSSFWPDSKSCAGLCPGGAARTKCSAAAMFEFAITNSLYGTLGDTRN